MEEKVNEKIKFFLITFKQKSLRSIPVYIYFNVTTTWSILLLWSEQLLEVWLFYFLFLFLNEYVTIYEAQCGISAHVWLALINQNG